MTAKGKINASKVQVGHRIIVKVTEYGVTESRTKTGEGVVIARVLAKPFRAASGPYEARGKYVIETTVGSFEAAPIQTMWLAPEDAAGIKRAHAEALAENSARRTAERNAAEAVRQAELDAKVVECPVCGGPLASDGVCADDDECGSDDERSAQAAGDRLSMTVTSSGAAKIVKLADEKLAQMVKDVEDDMARRAEIAASVTASLPPVEDRKSRTGGDVVRLLEKVWTRIREDHPELPDVVIITGSGMVGGSKWGHFRPDGWKDGGNGRHELFLAGEALAKGSAQVLQTMLHEGAHTLARVRDVKDTSRQGRWHNQTFRKLAVEMGLEHKGEQGDKSHGFSFVTLTEATKARYADLLAELDAQIGLTCHLPGWLGGEGEESGGGEKITGKPVGKGDGKARDVKTTCGCDEPLSIRLTRKALDRGTVKCGECDQLFTEAE